MNSNQGDQGFGQGGQGGQNPGQATQGNVGGGNVGGGNTGRLPRTGSDLDRLGLLGAALLATGGLFLVATKRRRTLRSQIA